jgi:hypothetical protein
LEVLESGKLGGALKSLARGRFYEALIAAEKFPDNFYPRITYQFSSQESKQKFIRQM